MPTAEYVLWNSLPAPDVRSAPDRREFLPQRALSSRCTAVLQVVNGVQADRTDGSGDEPCGYRGERGEAVPSDAHPSPFLGGKDLQQEKLKVSVMCCSFFRCRRPVSGSCGRYLLSHSEAAVVPGSILADALVVAAAAARAPWSSGWCYNSVEVALHALSG